MAKPLTLGLAFANTAVFPIGLKIPVPWSSLGDQASSEPAKASSEHQRYLVHVVGFLSPGCWQSGGP